MGDQLNLALALEGRAKAAPANAGLVAIAGALAQLPDPEIDATFALALEQRLLTEGIEITPVRHLQVVKTEPAFPSTPADEVVRRAPVIQIARRRHTVRRALAGSLAAAMVSAFPLVAAAKSLPGSPFYGLKVRIQHAQIALFGGAVSDGFAHAALAQERIGEAAQITALGADQSLIAATLRAANDELKAAQALILDNTSNPADLQKLAAIAEESEREIAAMTAVTGSAKAARDGALRTTKAIQTDVAEALAVEAATISVSLPSTDTTTSSLSGSTTYSTGSTTPSRTTGSGGSDGSTKTDPGEGSKKGNGGDGRNLNGPSEGCEVFGSEQFGDTFAIITEITCGHGN